MHLVGWFIWKYLNSFFLFIWEHYVANLQREWCRNYVYAYWKWCEYIILDKYYVIFEAYRLIASQNFSDATGDQVTVYVTSAYEYIFKVPCGKL